jgi:hypothetical protein
MRSARVLSVNDFRGGCGAGTWLRFGGAGRGAGAMGRAVTGAMNR